MIVWNPSMQNTVCRVLPVHCGCRRNLMLRHRSPQRVYLDLYGCLGRSISNNIIWTVFWMNGPPGPSRFGMLCLPAGDSVKGHRRLKGRLPSLSGRTGLPVISAVNCSKGMPHLILYERVDLFRAFALAHLLQQGSSFARAIMESLMSPFGVFMMRSPFS